MPSLANAARTHTDFVRLFQKREAEQRSKRPDVLDASQHETLRKILDELKFIPPVWADSTQLGVYLVAKKWKNYCESNSLGDWISILKETENIKAIAMDLLLWICENGAINSYGTTWGYFRRFKQLFVLTTRRDFAKIDTMEVDKWHKTVVIPRFKLHPPNMKEQPVVNADDLHALLVFNIAFDRGIFATERHRVINLPGICQALSGTGARPAEFVFNEKRVPNGKLRKQLFGDNGHDDDDDDDEQCLDDASKAIQKLLRQETVGRGRPKCFCYEDIRLIALRDQADGGTTFVLAMKLIHHKGEDRKPKPQVKPPHPLLARRPIFCLINTVIVAALRDGAFAAKGLTTAASIYNLQIPKRMQCLPLRWKEEWLKRPIFRMCGTSDPISEPPMTYDWLSSDLKRQSLEAGFEHAITPRAFRRGVSDAINGQASDAVRDQAMRHDPEWATFNSAYINQHVKFDVQSAFLNEPTQDSLINLMGHMSLTRDPSAKRNMVPPEVWDSLPIDPEILALERERETLKAGHYDIHNNPKEDIIRELTTQIRQKRDKRSKDVQEQYRRYYLENKPNWDIEEQLAGADTTELEEVKPEINLHIPERQKLAEILLEDAIPTSSIARNALWTRVADLMVALCQKREMPISAKLPLSSSAPSETQRLPVKPPITKYVCPRCVGDRRLPDSQRYYSYARASVMRNHFERQHLREMTVLESRSQITCVVPGCTSAGVKFETLDAYRNHAGKDHGFWLAPSTRRCKGRKAYDF
ncbi:FluG domain-containing protein [Microdochium trichocladiopsis]|uniref:FluG domain-containing protein n=1 Tax=Microdochium trichocladiopsis TaxID=1682393 RepID=A0A9P8XQT7_9PEZI|nr:FluG domain-containing protein [Microdochium trichocladiopsis]KAH7012294.1 FluG domain-containing protein [Microdochium trichocladiopsis]